VKTHDKLGRPLIGPDGKHRPSQQAGRKGGRPRKERHVPPPEEAIPAATTGHPTTCTPAVIKAFANVYARGVGEEDAARAIGVEPSTVKQWFVWGEKGREPYRTFVSKAMEAEAAAASGAADRVLADRPLDWLARVRPKRWAQRLAVDGIPAPAAVIVIPEWSRRDGEDE